MMGNYLNNNNTNNSTDPNNNIINNGGNNLIISETNEELIRHLTNTDAIKARKLSIISFPVYYTTDYFIESFDDKKRYYSIGIFPSSSSSSSSQQQQQRQLSPTTSATAAAIGGYDDDESNDLRGFIISLPNYVEDEKRAEYYSEPEKALIQRFNSRIAYISSLAVHPCYMRRGYATKMINALIEICSKWNPEPLALFLHVQWDNYRAICFYEKFGFLRDAFIKNYYGENVHGYLYVRILEQRRPSTLLTSSQANGGGGAMVTAYNNNKE